MQTRKRAKSATFGKKKEELKETKGPEEPKEIKAEVSDEQKAIKEEPAASADASDSAKASTDKTSEPKEDDLLEQVKTVVENPSTGLDPEQSRTGSVQEEKESPPRLELESEQADEPKETASASLDSAQGKSSGEAEETPLRLDEAERAMPSAFYVQDSHLHTSERTHKKSSKLPLFFFIVAFISFVVGLGGALLVDYAFKNSDFEKQFNVKELFSKFVPQPTPTATPTPSTGSGPTAAPIDLSAHTISVLNGSGISGQAAKLKAQLTEAGFKVSTTGNADSDTYTKTKIVAKENVSNEYLKKLEEELKKSYVVDKVSKLSDSASPDVDITITIGSEKAK